MKRLFLCVLLLALLSGCADSVSFKEKFDALQRTEANFHSSGLTPTEIPKIVALQSELNKVKVSLSKQPRSSENSALTSLIDAKFDLLEMRLSFEKGKLEMAKAKFSEADCRAGGALVNAADFFGKAVASSSSAKSRLQSFFKNYPAEAKQTGMVLGDVSLTIDLIAENASTLRDGVLGLC